MPLHTEVDVALDESPTTSQRAREEMAQRVQRAMVESSLTQSGAYGSKKQRSTMDELYMDLKGLQLARASELQAHPSSSSLRQPSSRHPEEVREFSWEKAHQEWEQAQRALLAKAAASRNCNLPNHRLESAPAGSSASSSSPQPWSGMPASVDKGQTSHSHGSSQQQQQQQQQHRHHHHYQGSIPAPAHPAEPHASAHVSLLPPQPPQATAETAALGAQEGDLEGFSQEEEQEAGQQPSSSKRWGEKTKAVLMKMHIGRSNKHQQLQQPPLQQQQQQGEGEREVLQHPVQGRSMGSLGEEADLLPHHRSARQHSPHATLLRSPSASSSARGKASTSHAAAPPRRGLSASLALPSMGSVQGGILGKGSLKTAMAMLLGTEDKH